MLIDYGNVVRHTLLRRYDKERIEPLLGGKFQLHGGMGFHIGLAWTVVYNFMTLMVDACHDYKEHEYSAQMTSYSSQMTSERWESEAKLSNLEDIPWGISPFQQIGGHYQISDPFSVNQEWLKNVKTREEQCNSTLNDVQKIVSVCTYAWMVSGLAGIMTPEHIDKAFSNVMKSSYGWEAQGTWYTIPRLAYVATTEKATFSLKIHVSSPTEFFTILLMESYGPNFVGTNLRIEVNIEYDNPPMAYNVSGYHNMKTSVLVPHKFRLPRIAQQGESIHFKATLTRGAYFRISGLAFCKQ
jgi:hypothetical protein